MPGMRVRAVKHHLPGEMTAVPDCAEVVIEAIRATAVGTQFTLTVSIGIDNPSILGDVAGVLIGLKFVAPNKQQHRCPKHEVHSGTTPGSSALGFAVSGSRSYKPLAELLLKHGALQAIDDTASLVKIVMKLIDDKHLDLASKIVHHTHEVRGRLLVAYIARGDHDVVRWLVDLGCDVNTGVPVPPLAAAAKQGDSRTVTFLLDKGANTEIVLDDGSDPLLDAILDGQAAAATLLACLPSRINPTRADQMPPLHIAASKGLVKVAKALIGVNADINAVRQGGNCLWAALMAAPNRPMAPLLKTFSRKRYVDVDRTTQKKISDYEELAMFFCSRGVSLQSEEGMHPLDYVDLAASKGYWKVVDALVELVRKSYATSVLDRIPPYDDSRAGEALLQVNGAPCNPSEAARRDVFSYAAACGQVDVVQRLAIGWGLKPSPGREASFSKRNALDYAFEGSSVELCLMLLSRGLLPTRHVESSNKEVKQLFSNVSQIIGLAFGRRKVNDKWVEASKPFPKLPVNILEYSMPGDISGRQPGRVQITEDGAWFAGTVTDTVDGELHILLDNGREVQVDPDKVDVFNDHGHTILHELVAQGALGHLKLLIQYSSSHPEKAHRFNASACTTTAGSLLYTAAVYKQEDILESLIDDYHMKATTHHGRSPLLAAVHHGSLSMVQKLVVSAQADVNEAGTIQNERLFRESKLVGHTVTPLYLAAALGECDIAAFLIPRQGRVMSGRTYEGGVESPLHACLARAVPNVSKQSGSYAYTPKRQVIKCAAVQKIASMLIRANCDVNEVSFAPAGKVATHVLNIASARGYFHIVQDLLDKGADVSSAVAAVCDDSSDVYYTGRHVLHYLAAAGELSLLRKCIGDEHCTDAPDLLLPTHVAPEAMFRNLSKEIHILGTTADAALQAQRPAVLAFLLSRGVKVSCMRCTAAPKLLPAARGTLAKNRFVLEHNKDKAPSNMFSYPTDASLTNQLITLTGDVARPSSASLGFGYLHASCRSVGAADAACLLIQSGFDVNATVSAPYVGEVTPLWLCAALNNQRLLTVLLGSPTLRAKQGKSPLPHAVLNGNKKIVQGMVERGVDVNACETFLYPVSQWSRQFWGLRDVANVGSMRVSYGTNAVVSDATALFLACNAGWEEIVKCIHTNGGDLKEDTSVVRKRVFPSHSSYYLKPHFKLKKKSDDDEYHDEEDQDEVSQTPKPKIFKRMQQDIKRRKEQVLRQFELEEEHGAEIDSIAFHSLRSAYGSVYLAYKHITLSGAATDDKFDTALQTAGLSSSEISSISSSVTPGMSFKQFKDLFKKTRESCTGPYSVSFLDADATNVRPIWAVINGAPIHPCKVKYEQKLREKIERYIRTARFVIQQEGLKGLSNEELTALILVACHKGHWEIAAKILQEGSRTSRDAHFLTEVSDEDVQHFAFVKYRHPIHIAARFLEKELFYLFLKRTKKHDVSNLRDPLGYTALHNAILAGNTPAVDVLLELGSFPSSPAGGGTRVFSKILHCKKTTVTRGVPGGVTALMLAARANHVQIVTQLLKAGAHLDEVDDAGNTALIHACEMGNVGVVESLVSSNAAVDVLNNLHYSALMRACVRGHTEVAVPLLQYWTRHDGLTSTATSVLHCAAEGGCDGVVDLLMNDFDLRTVNALEPNAHPGSGNCSALWIGWALGRWQIKAKLLEHLQRREKDGTPEEPQSLADKILLAQLGKREEVTDEIEDTLIPGWLSHALSMAARIHAKLSGSKGMAQSFPTDLVHSPAVPSLRVSLRTGCSIVRMKSSKDVGGLLPDNARLETFGADTHFAARRARVQQWSLLEWAARANNAVVVKVLGDHCLPDHCNAIHLAAERGNLDIVQILLQLQMSAVSAVNHKGETALMKAIMSGKEKIALFLMSKTPARRLLKLTEDGKSLLHLCALSGLEDAVAHMIGCLVQLERRLKGEENLNLHDFINLPDRHTDIEDYDSEDEGEPNKYEAEAATTGFTPFEYALMFGHAAIALRLAYGSTLSSAARRGTPSISLNPRFPGTAGYNLPVMSATIRAMLSEFFNDPSRGFEHGPATIRGDYIRHPSHWAQDEDGKWPKEKTHIVFNRLTWPDVRAVGIANLSRIPWVSEKLAEIQTFEHERNKYASLLMCLELQGRAIRLNTASLGELSPADRLTVLQHLASTLIIHRYTARDHDWTSATGGIKECNVLGVDKKRKKVVADSRVAEAADGLIGQVSCVQLEFVKDKSQVRVVVDSEGVVHERFTFANGYIGCGNLDDAMEAHFKRKERIAKSETDTVIKEVTAWLRESSNPLINKLYVTVDWRAVDKYRFDTPYDRIKSFEVLASRRGVWSLVDSLGAMASVAFNDTKRSAAAPFSGIAFRRAGWIDGQFFITEEATDDAKRSPTELVVFYDVRGGDAHFSSLSKSLSQLFVYNEFEMLRRAVAEEARTLEKAVHPYLPETRCKIELEGSWRIQVGGADMVLCSIKTLMSDIIIKVKSLVGTEHEELRKESDSKWTDLHSKPIPDITLVSLLHAALRRHVRSIGVLISSRREPTVKFVASSKTIIICIKAGPSDVMLTSESQLTSALYHHIIEVESARLQEQMKTTLTDAQHRLMTYLPTTTLSVNWKSFDDLEGEARFVAIGTFCHSRGAKVLQPLISGMSVGWDSKLGGFVRKYVKQIVIHCTRGWQSYSSFDDCGVFNVYIALLAGSAGCMSMMSAQEIATDVIIHLEQLDEARPTFEEYVDRTRTVTPATAPRITDYVDTTNAFPCWCASHGKNLREVEAGSEGTFTIYARNILNCKCGAPVAPEPFSVSITNLSNDPLDVPATIRAPDKSSRDSSLYKVSYTAPTTVGWYLIHVTLNGVPISRSPYRLRVHPQRSVSELVPADKHINTLTAHMPVVLVFRALDDSGNFCTNIERTLRQGEKVTIKSDVGVVRKAQQKYNFWDPVMEGLCGEDATVVRTMGDLGVVTLLTGMKTGCLNFSLECIEAKGSRMKVEAHGREVEVGKVLDGRDGSCSVRIVPLEEGEIDVTLSIDKDGEELTCTQHFNVISQKQALAHVSEYALAPWEKKMRKNQMYKWEKGGWKQWKKEDHLSVQVAFPLDVQPSNRVGQTAVWLSSLRKEVSTVKHSTYKEWSAFRKDMIKDKDRNAEHQVPRWWMKEKFDRFETLHEQEIRLPETQELIFMRMALQPQEIHMQLLKMLKKVNYVPQLVPCRRQDTSRARPKEAIPSTSQHDKHLQTALDKNGGGKSSHNVKLPMVELETPGSLYQAEVRTRRNDMQVLHPLLSINRS
eukprot:TRINITY_DN14220_c0_g1_i3.p1 TRINITY_DN14220_c0_g1~~TRINITY_DN14220_c0_g1_i3.p1  ORF type:complete len:3265 (+),score=842.75 TRINITY_DN14220_c0_g1_i3:5889-15683(+)